MSPALVFFFGVVVLMLFGWYFATEIERRKRMLGSVLTVMLLALCLESLWPPQETVRLGIDLKGGTSFLIRIVREEGREISPDLLEQAKEVIRKRVDEFGVGEPVIAVAGEDRILVQIPGLDTAQIEQARQQLQKVAKLEFKLVHPQSEYLVPQIEDGEAIIPPGWELKSYMGDRDVIEGEEPEEREKLLVRRKADLEGDRVSEAFATYGDKGWEIILKFDGEGARLFGELTAAHVKERFAIVLDGEIQSAPVIQSAIYGGTASITGRFKEAEARNLSSVLENPLAAPVEIAEQRSVSATLGADSIKSGVYAGIAGMILTLLFVLVYYKFAGVLANLALIINILLLFGAMTMFNFVLTLPGIAGIILTIGMAIDANVLIYERLREEMAMGKTLRTAVDSAYAKAFSSIFDANITTLITALILFWRATGPVKGFAITLTVGILASMFTALLVTRTSFRWAFALGLLKRINMLNLIPSKAFDFLGKRRGALLISLALIIGSIATVAMRGDRALDIDFKGGDLLVMEARQMVAEADARRALSDIGLAESVVQIERSPAKEFLTVRSAPATSTRILEHLNETFPDAGLVVDQEDHVGPLIGKELATNSLIALGLGMLGILIYVTVRFEFSFALGALVAVVHDVVITLGLFAAFGRELSLIMVGAVLTIAGYSINDTIVVFDRIREAIRSGRPGSIVQIMNAAINDTLSRTILTGGTTLTAVLALYLFGGPVLNDFALAIIIGVIVGTYSSIFIATPIVLWWSGRKGRSLRREVRIAEDAPIKA